MKMITYKILVPLFCISIMICSCKKFLDEPQNSLQGSLNSVEACQSVLDGTNIFNYRYPIDDELYAGEYYLSDDDFNGLSDESRAIYQWLPTAQRSMSSSDYVFQWKAPYEAIYQANVILEALETITIGTSINEQAAAYNQAKGIALFHRGFLLYHMASLYAKAYDPNTANQDAGVPVRIKSDITAVPQRGTVKQTYDQIISDLKQAAELLPVTTLKPTRPNKVAAYAALARVYLAIGDYVNAGAAANSALTLYNLLIDYNTLDVNSDVPFVQFNKEVLFDALPGGSFELLDPNRAKVNLDLYGLYAANDLRKQLFYKDNGNGTYQFKGGYGSNVWRGIATDELYLIRAESYARAGNVNAAMTDLNNLLRTRWKTGTYINMTAGTADDALSKILLERRKEFAFRPGMRWSDLKRLNKDSRFAVTLSRTVNGTTYTLPPNDLRYQILLPEDVMTYSSLPQNPR